MQIPEDIMNIEDILQRDVVSVRPYEDLLSAAKLMRDKHVGYIVVVEPAIADGTFRPIGVLTDRDIVVTVVAREADVRTLRVEDVMTRKPVVARRDEPLATALQDMRRIGVRRLPVVGEHGELVGVISLDEVVAGLADRLQDVAGSIRSEQLVERALRP
jgi:CBS domain-containing protein